MSDSFLIRDFFSPAIVRKIAKDIKTIFPTFDGEGFISSILKNLASQTYSERKDSIKNTLTTYLPGDYNRSLKFLLKALPPPYGSEVLTDTLDRFYVSAYTAYISQNGLDNFDESMEALYIITKSFTSEWDIRPFLIKDPKKGFQYLKKWVKDDNPHVRRLVSEGSRPNLPWGKKLKLVVDDPQNTSIPLLRQLYNDPSEYVRRSVANHLNDLTKTHPDLVVDELQTWKGKNPSKEKMKLINHALRTLIKQGHSNALELIGFTKLRNVITQIDDYSKEVGNGSKLEFTFSIHNKGDRKAKILVDYIIGFQKKDGSISHKVFKLKKLVLESGASISITKSQSFKPITTRAYYPGKHTLTLQLNGVKTEHIEFKYLGI